MGLHCGRFRRRAQGRRTEYLTPIEGFGIIRATRQGQESKEIPVNYAGDPRISGWWQATLVVRPNPMTAKLAGPAGTGVHFGPFFDHHSRQETCVFRIGNSKAANPPPQICLLRNHRPGYTVIIFPIFTIFPSHFAEAGHFLRLYTTTNCLLSFVDVNSLGRPESSSL